MDEKLKSINGRFYILQGSYYSSIERFAGLMALASKSGVDFNDFYENFKVEQTLEVYNRYLAEKGFPDLTKEEIMIAYERAKKNSF